MKVMMKRSHILNKRYTETGTEQKACVIFQNDPTVIPDYNNQVVTKIDEKDLRQQMFMIYQSEFQENAEKQLKYLDSEGICVLVFCKHIFHKRCIKQWLKNNNTCPF